MGRQQSLFRLFSAFYKQTLQFWQQINVKNYPSSTQCRDLNPWRSEYEFLP